MPRRRFSDEDASVGEANVLPIMNIMLLLVPALLLAMEVASMAAVPSSVFTVTTPVPPIPVT